MVNLDHVKRLIQEVESSQFTNVVKKSIESVEDLKKVLTNEDIHLQYDWTGKRSHIKKIIGLASTRPEAVTLGEVTQFERIDYGKPTCLDRFEIPPTFDPDARYAVLVHEIDEINYRHDYQHEETYTLYTYNDEDVA
ncbi:MAG: hypothetical protein AB1420_15515 [Bacillota bacterium]